MKTANLMGLFDKISLWLGKGKKEASVLVLGLNNSGKSTLLNNLRPEEQRVAHIAPTVGYNVDKFQGPGVSFSAWDMSGHGRHRALWEHHYRNANAIIFVIDSSDHLRLVVAKDELELLLQHPDIYGRRIPIMFFANKSDCSGALSSIKIAAALGLERITDKPWHICESNALTGAGLQDGVAWLARQLRDAPLK